MTVFISRRMKISAAHSYQNLPANSVGEGRSGVRRAGAIHGHNYTIDLTYAGSPNERTGMVVNITEIDGLMKEVLCPLNESFLEQDHPHVAWGLPTTENLARWIWNECEDKLLQAKLTGVRVQETDCLWSEYHGDEEGYVLVTRSYEFSAAHRLHSALLSDEENIEVFGKCNNPNGHGHNYLIEVTVRGKVDETTGMACDISEIDRAVEDEVMSRLDHKHLNLDVPELEGLNPTSENVAIIAWKLLQPRLKDALYRVRIRETELNYFDYMGED